MVTSRSLSRPLGTLLAAALIGCDGGAQISAAGTGAAGVMRDSGAPFADASSSAPDVSARDAGPDDARPSVDRRCPAERPPEPPAALRTFYVDGNNGDDADDGRSPETAWRTLGAANDAAMPGDLFLLSGAFTGQAIRPRRSGTAEAKIVYRASTEGGATIRDVETALDLSGVSHVVVDGVEITATGGAAANLLGASEVWLLRLDVHDAGVVGLYHARDNRIGESAFRRCSANCLNVLSGATGNVIRGNDFGDAGGRNIWLSASAAANVIRGNTFSNGTGSALTLASDGSIVECNSFEGNAAIAIWVNGADNIVRLNLVHGSAGEGITIRSHTNQSISRNVIAYNTIVGNGGPCLRMNLANASTMEDNLIAYNLCWGNNLKSNIHWENHGHQYKVVVDQFHATVKWPVGDLHGNVLRGNLFGKDVPDIGTRWMWFIGETTVRLTLSEAETTFTDTLSGNIEIDPLFVDEEASDLRLGAESPAIDRGAPMDGIWYAGTAPDLGRFESVPTER